MILVETFGVAVPDRGQSGAKFCLPTCQDGTSREEKKQSTGTAVKVQGFPRGENQIKPGQVMQAELLNRAWE